MTGINLQNHLFQFHPDFNPMTVIKLFGATITVKVDHVHDRDRAGSKMTTTTSSSSLSSSLSSDQGAEGDRTKKPDKIIPCPRCKSMETKFCYFNNYNVNQPRHFCKGCHRYWTAGGALRNVPVGAGRRKSRPPPSTPHQPCWAAGDGMYEDSSDQWQFMEQGSLQLQLQHVEGIKRRRIGFDCDYDQFC